MKGKKGKGEWGAMMNYALLYWLLPHSWPGRETVLGIPVEKWVLEQLIVNKMPSSLRVSVSHHLTSLCMSFVICKRGLVLIPVPEGHYEG